jgi:hypothetical protein
VPPPRHDALQLLQLRQRDGPLQLGHAVVIREERGVALGNSRLAVVALVGSEAQTGSQPLIAGNHDAAVATGDVLELVQAEAADVAECANRFTHVSAAERLRTVLDQPQVVPAADVAQCVQVAGVAPQMHRKHRPRARGDSRLY